MSAWKDILDGVNTLVSAVSGVPTVTLLKSPFGLPATVLNSLPAVIICPIAQETTIEHAFTSLSRFDYPVGIFIIYAHNRSFTITATMPNMRELIRQSIDKRPPLSGVSTVFDVEIAHIPLYTHEDNPDTVVDVTGIVATYCNWETRTNS